jgi:hypothetical protein
MVRKTKRLKRGGVHPITARIKSRRLARKNLGTRRTLNNANLLPRPETRAQTVSRLDREWFAERRREPHIRRTLRRRLDDYKRMPAPRWRTTGTPSAITKRNKLIRLDSKMGGR